MHQSLQGATVHLEHIQPISKDGSTTLDNLAWCCPSCNLHKSDRTVAADPDTQEYVPLFHPRQMVWQDHFEWDGYTHHGRTPTGPATIVVFQINNPRRVRIREAEERFGLIPPSS
jgi:hypothetical protein